MGVAKDSKDKEREREKEKRKWKEGGPVVGRTDRQTLRDQRQVGERSWRPQDRPGCRAAWETSQRRTSVGRGRGKDPEMTGMKAPSGRELPSQAL